MVILMQSNENCHEANMPDGQPVFTAYCTKCGADIPKGAKLCADCAVRAGSNYLQPPFRYGEGFTLPDNFKNPVILSEPDEEILFQYKGIVNGNKEDGILTLTTQRVVWNTEMSDENDPTKLSGDFLYDDSCYFAKMIDITCGELINLPCIRIKMIKYSVFEKNRVYDFAFIGDRDTDKNKELRDWVADYIRKVAETAKNVIKEEVRMHKKNICKYCGGKRTVYDKKCKGCGKGSAFVCNKCGGTLGKTNGKCKNCTNDFTVCMYCGASNTPIMNIGVSGISGICFTCGRPRKY
jgi:ribosomal protein L40E